MPLARAFESSVISFMLAELPYTIDVGLFKWTWLSYDVLSSISFDLDKSKCHSHNQCFDIRWISIEWLLCNVRTCCTWLPRRVWPLADSSTLFATAPLALLLGLITVKQSGLAAVTRGLCHQRHCPWWKKADRHVGWEQESKDVSTWWLPGFNLYRYRFSIAEAKDWPRGIITIALLKTHLMFSDWHRRMRVECKYIQVTFEKTGTACPHWPCKYITVELKYSTAACLTPRCLKIHALRGYIQMLSLREYNIYFLFTSSTLNWIGSD